MRRLLLPLALSACLLTPGAAHAELVARWSLDDVIGGVAPDLTGHGHDGTPQFGASLVSGGARFSGALRTEPATDPRSGLLVPADAALRPGTVSVVAWVRAPTAPGPLRTVIAQGATGCLTAAYALATDTSGRLTFAVGSGTGATRSPAAPPTIFDDAWHSVVGTYDGQAVRLYVDGAQVGSGTTAPAIDYGSTSTTDMTIGTFPAATACEANTAWPGLIDEVRVYDTALRASDAAWLAGSTQDPRDVPAPDPAVHTTGAGDVTLSGARVAGTIDPAGLPREWFVEFGPTTAYGQRTASFALEAGQGARAVTADLGGLTPATTYHARIVADGIGGEDVTFTTLAPPPDAPPGLPATVDFGWSPPASPLTAGQPVTFAATDAPGATYAWDFDFHADDGFRPGATGNAPTHAFRADGAHDVDRVDGASGERRRSFVVRLRMTAADGTQADVDHLLVVTPNDPPLADFTVTRATTGVNSPVTFTPQARDPEGALVTLAWDLESDGVPDVVCDGAGAACTAPGGAPLPAWLVPGADGSITVNFFERALAAHGLQPLGRIDLNALPAGAPGGIAIAAARGATVYSPRDPRLAYLYDNATLLQQSSFNTDAGEATGARLATGSLRQSLGTTLTSPARRRVAGLLATRRLAWRQVTLTAADAAGAQAAVAKPLPLAPDAAPKLQAQFVNRDPSKRTLPVFIPGRAGSGAGDTQRLGYTLTTADEIAFDASATSDPDGRVAWYTLEVGQPYGTSRNACFPELPKAQPTTISPIPTPGELRPGGAFTGAPVVGAGPPIPRGPVGNVPLKGPNPRKPGASFRLAGPKDRPLATLLGGPLLHGCIDFTRRNVEPGVFRVRPGASARPATFRGVDGALLTPNRLGLEYDTTAIVTRDPRDLRFRIPRAGTYSVAIGAYDEAGLGAIQRTDGLQVFDAVGTCKNIGGEPLRLGSRRFGVSGQCVDFGASRTRFWSTRPISVNGVGLRAVGGAIYIDVDGKLVATRSSKPRDLASADVDALSRNAADVEILANGQPVARVSDLTVARAAALLRNELTPTVPEGARFFGSPIARPATPGPDPAAFSLQFGATDGRSLLHFNTVLPTEFSRGGEKTAPTGEVLLRGRDEPRSTEIETERFAEIARRTARAADAGTSTLDLSGTSLGPVSIDEGRLTFDPARGYWEGTLAVTLNVASPVTGARMHIVIADGELKEASGSASTIIPLFAGVTLDELRFSIVTDPLTVSGGATVSVVKILRGDIDVLVRADPVLLRLTGRISLLNVLPLGGAYVQYDAASHKTLTFGGNLGVDLGPASIEARLDGGISFETGDFFVQGSGEACVFICLGVDALISSRALAACGSINLLIGKVSAGFAYVFGDGLELFWGCDLGPYRPAVFQVRGGVTADARQAGGGGLVVPEGADSVSFRFRGDPGLATAPKLTLTAPDGRVFTTGALPGDYGFTPPGPNALAGQGAGRGTPAATAMIDEDPLTKTTTILVARPPAGTWQVALAPGQPPLRAAELALGEHVDTDALRAAVQDVDLVGRDRVRIGNRVVRTDDAELREEPSIERPRQRGALLAIPRGANGRMVIADVSGSSATILRRVDLARYAGRRLPVVFTPTTEPGRHELKAMLLHPDGTPRAAVTIGGFTPPAVQQPTAPRIDVSADRRGGGLDVTVDVRPGSAGPLTDPAAQFEVVAQTASGRRVERIVDRMSSRARPDGRFRFDLGRFSRREYRTLRVSGRMLYAGRAGVTRRAR